MCYQIKMDAKTYFFLLGFGRKYYAHIYGMILSVNGHNLFGVFQLGELIQQGPSSSETSQSLSRSGEWSRPHRIHSQVLFLSHTHRQQIPIHQFSL